MRTLFKSILIIEIILLPRVVRAAPCPGADAWEADDTIATAKPVTVDGAIQARTLDSKTNYDYISFNATACQSYLITASATGTSVGVLDLVLTMYHSSGVTFATDDDNGPVTLCPAILFNPVTTGTYYAEVRSYSLGTCGNYNFQVQTQPGTPDAYEADDTYLTAKPVTVGAAPTTHTFHSCTDEDWYSFTATAGDLYLFYAKCSATGASGDLKMEIYDSNGTSLLNPPGTVDKWYRPFEFTTFKFATTGTYYVRLKEFSGVIGPLTTYSFFIRREEWQMPFSTVIPSLVDTGINPGTEYADAFTSTFPWGAVKNGPDGQVWIKRTGNAPTDTIYVAYRIGDTQNNTTSDQFQFIFEGCGTNTHDHALVADAAPITQLLALEDRSTGADGGSGSAAFYWDGATWFLDNNIPKPFVRNVNWLSATFQWDVEFSIPVSWIFPAGLTDNVSNKGVALRWGDNSTLSGAAHGKQEYPIIHDSPADDSVYYVDLICPPLPTPTPTQTHTMTHTYTRTLTWSVTLTPTISATWTPTWSVSHTPSWSQTLTSTQSASYTPTWSPTISPTWTSTVTTTWTPTVSPTRTFTASASSTPTNSSTISASFTASGTPSSSPTITPLPPCALGMTVAGAINSPPGSYNNTIWASGFQLTSAATAYSLNVYIPPAFGGSGIRAAIYNGTAFIPSTLIVQSASQTAVGGWNYLDIADTPLSAGNYWLAFQNQNGCLSYTVDCAAYYASYGQVYGAFPASPGFSGGSCQIMPIYADLCPPPSPTPSPTATISDTASPTDTITQTSTASPTATLTSTPTWSPTSTWTGTGTFSVTPTSSWTSTPTPSHSPTSTDSPTRTVTRTATATDSSTSTDSPTRTGTLTATPTFTHSPTSTASPTFTWTPTATWTATPTFTASPTSSGSTTASPTLTATPTPSWTATATASASPTYSVSDTETSTWTRTASPTGTSTVTLTFSPTPTNSPTRTWTPSSTPTDSPTGTASPTDSATATPTWSPSRTATPTASPSSTWTSTATASASPTYSVSDSDTATFTRTFSPTGTSTATPTASPTSTPSPTSSITPSGTPSFSPTSTPSPTDSSTATPTWSPSLTATPTVSPSPTWTRTATASASPTYSVSDSDTATWTRTSTPTATSTVTPTHSPTFTQSPTSTWTPSSSSTASPSATSTSTFSPSSTSTPSASPTDSATRTPTRTDSPTGTDTRTATPTYSPSSTATPSASPTDSATRTATRTDTATGTETRTGSPTGTVSPSRTDTGTPSSSPTPSATRTASSSTTVTPTGSASRTASPSGTASRTASGSTTASPSLTASATPSASRTISLTPTISSTLTPTPPPDEPLVLSDNVFYPEQAPLGLKGRAAERGRIEVSVYNIVGEKIAEPLTLDVVSGQIYAARWDGKNRNGQPAGDGLYLVVLRSPSGLTIRKVIVLR